MRQKAVLLGVLLLLCACEQDYYVEIKLEGSHPWEKASGRHFWYTLIYQAHNDLVQIHLPIGVKRLFIAVPRGQTVVCVAYPLGSGLPFGGGSTLVGGKKEIVLRPKEGLLCEALLNISKQWPAVIAQLSYEKVLQRALEVDHWLFSLDWNHLAYDVVGGTMSSSSFKKVSGVDVVLEELVDGTWVCESESIPPFTLYYPQMVELKNVQPGLLRFVNLEKRMELRIVIPFEAEEPPFWHIGPLASLLGLSDSLYYQLLEDSRSYL